ncbi:MAG: outer membrane protein assembly factor BamA, partial [Alphaproteobacteria bacterium]|nr:outer membrane protein assembly factor BamA [Alphaproteobacteria bacterium]
MKIKTLKSLLIVMMGLSCATDADAVVLSRIDVSGNQRMDAESVRILSEVKVGNNVNSETVNDVAKKLQSSGYFSSVNASLDGSVLRIKVEEAPIINMVTVEGNDEIDTDDLKKEIKTKERASYDKSVIGGDVQRMLTLYQRKGFFGTKINPKKINLDNNRVNVVYEIKEGHPTYIENIDFENNKKFRSRTLRGELLSREHAWWRFMTQFDVYDEDRIQYDQQLLNQFYMRNGFLDFRITDVKGNFTENREYYSVKYTVDEGEQYRIGDISIDNPFDDVSNKELDKALTISKKDIYNIDEIDATIEALRGAVADHGYAFISVEPVTEKHDDTRTVDIKFEIKKTNRIYINSINLLGNVRTFDNVIEHHLPMREG